DRVQEQPGRHRPQRQRQARRDRDHRDGGRLGRGQRRDMPGAQPPPPPGRRALAARLAVRLHPVVADLVGGVQRREQRGEHRGVTDRHHRPPPYRADRKAYTPASSAVSGPTTARNSPAGPSPTRAPSTIDPPKRKNPVAMPAWAAPVSLSSLTTPPPRR